MNGSGPGSARSVSPGSTFAPSSGFTGLPEVIPPGHTEHATPVGAPILTPAEPSILSHISLTRRWFSAHDSNSFFCLFLMLVCY
ncbi:hypothetical protein L960_0695c [Escherichia coli B7A]|nr:hypothetical protein L960_0695c [Escherichia coli B7A]